MYGFIQMVEAVVLGGVLPVTLMWLFMRYKMNDTNKHAQVLLAAIDKNPEMDIEELIKKLTPTRKLLKEKLLNKLLWGSLFSVFGVGIIVMALAYPFYNSDSFILFGLIFLAIGIAFFINFAVGKKMLSKEIETEERLFTTQK
ncbi:MAG: hypothetical protein IJ845_05690 [Bacteroidaceae bacterium]|nr:hypothetical protein [Bacteroidaceae bacterium]